MGNNVQNSELLIIADEDIVYGIEHGYYPDFSRNLRNGSLVICPIGSNYSKYKLTKPPVGNGMDFYIWNPSAGNYLSMWDSDLANTLVKEKSFAVKEALVYMGAKDIVLVEETGNQENISTKVQNNIGVKTVTVDFDFDYISNISVNVKSVIESHDPNRVAKPYEVVLDFLQRHGLVDDASLMMLLERLRIEGEIHGIEKYTVSYLNEVQNAIDIAANINVKLFNDKLDFSHAKKVVHTMSKTLEINFG